MSEPTINNAWLQQVVGGLRQRKQPVLITNKKAAIFFQGYLTNLDELINDLVSGVDMASSYGSSECEPVQFTDGDQGHIAAQVILQMYLRTGNESDKLAMLLSELQVITLAHVGLMHSFSVSANLSSSLQGSSSI